jgi:hypothetical protein
MNVPELVVDLDTFTAQLVTPAAYQVTLEVAMPGVVVGVPGSMGPMGPIGIQGPVGPAGLIKVNHGTDPDVARPSAPLVYWVGYVQPVNADPDDLLMLKEV